jgi:D-3-phosphoglycerate dehydrogenase
MNVVAYDPYLTDERAAEIHAERAELHDVLERADVVLLHVPLTDTTRGMIAAAELARMKKGSFLVNVARGGVVDEGALAAALESGHPAGAALDVFANEPLEEGSALRRAPNLVLTPHLGASTQEAQELVATEIAEAVRAALAEGDLSRALNAPAIGGDTVKALGPLFRLGEALGHLARALAPGGVYEVEVRYAGDSDEALEPLTAYVLVGLLRDVLGADQVNFVSAGHLARERGIGVARTRLSQHEDYTEYVEIVVRADEVFDVDEDGTIGLSEFSDFYGVFGLAVSLAETVFDELDADGDGVITRSELLDISRQFYRSDDVEAAGNVLFGPIGA